MKNKKGLLGAIAFLIIAAAIIFVIWKYYDTSCLIKNIINFFSTCKK